ncbi:MAG: hypothetical protein LBQ31_03075 [Bacteroidales bacterium]|nr:hypothetical protein [Bacteroidales bacterium]
MMTIRKNTECVSLWRGWMGCIFTQHLHIALNHIGKITGKIHSVNILSNIFGKFCIEKKSLI